MEKRTKKIFRDAISGQIVSKEFAEANPETTVSDTVPIPERRPETDEGEAGFSVEHDWSKTGE
jgi:hypothetical protein